MVVLRYLIIVIVFLKFKGDVVDIKFENLAKIDILIQMVEQLESKVSGTKRWLNINETAHYLGYSKDRIYKFQNNTFIENLHFYKKQGKILFDRVAIDEWVICKDKTNEINQSSRQTVDNILSSIKKT